MEDEITQSQRSLNEFTDEGHPIYATNRNESNLSTDARVNFLIISEKLITKTRLYSIKRLK